MVNKLKRTIAITGAGGFVGSSLVDHFSAHGWHVLAMVRTPEDYTHKQNVTYSAYDIAKPLSANLLKGVHTLVHTAYVKYDKAHPDALDINVRGARDLAKNCEKHSVTNIIFMSSMSAHDEAISVYGKQKLAVERAFDSRSTACIRSGLIIGNGGIVKQMADFMRSKHAVPLIGGGRQPIQIIAIYDLVRCIEEIATKQLHGTFVVATPQVYTYKEFYVALARSLNLKVFLIPVPFSLLLGLFRLASLFRLPLGVGEDNLMGLKMLRAMESSADLKKIGIKLDLLDVALANARKTSEQNSR